MARKRTIHPNWFTDDRLARCSPSSVLLYIGLHTIADREGRLLDIPLSIHVSVFPHDVGLTLPVQSFISELLAVGVLVRYVGGGRSILWIADFAKTQRPHVNEVPSDLAEVPQDHREVVPQDHRDLNLEHNPKHYLEHSPPVIPSVIPSTPDPDPDPNADPAPERGRASAHRPQQRRGPDPSLRSSTAWESITPTGAAPVARDIEGIARSIWRRTLSLSDAMHLERRGKSGEDFIPPPGQLDPITALVLVNDDATLDAAVKRAQGADKPRAFLMAMADENGRISLRAPSHAAAEQNVAPRPAVDAEKWWRFTEGLRCVVGDFVDCGRCQPDLDSVVDLAGSLAPEFGVVLPPDDAIRPVIGAWLAKRAAS